MQFLLHDGIDLFFRKPRVHTQTKGYIFFHIERVKERGILKDHPHRAALLIQLLFAELSHILSVHKDFSGCRAQKTDDEL